MTKSEIKLTLERMAEQVRAAAPCGEGASLDSYTSLVRHSEIDGVDFEIWTDALQKALDENPVVRIPAREKAYYIDAPVLIGGGRRIDAHGACLLVVPHCRALLMRNKSVVDGSNHAEDKSVSPDHGIVIEGGIWGESNEKRLGYGRTGALDFDNSMPGVTTCLLFSNVEDLYLRDMEFVHTAGFAVQIGNCRRAAVQDVHFTSCFADGVHLNGNIWDVLVKNISGNVGDDLVALNPYDWDNSGINFGPAERVYIDGVFSDADARYKAIRLQPGVYLYPDGGSSDCRIDDLYLRRVTGIKSYKLYLQTISYKDEPEHPALVGSCGNMYFDDLDIGLDSQIDAGLYEGVRYTEGYNIFGAFEVLADVENMELENINLTLHLDEYPETCLVSVGPKSMTGGGLMEVFDPYASCRVKHIAFKNITVNGVHTTDPRKLIRVIKMKFNPDFPNTFPRGGEGEGRVDSVTIK